MRILIIILLSLIVSCRQQNVPDNILSEQQMVHTLMEIYLAEDKFGKAGIPYDSMMKLSPVFRERVFMHIDIPDSVFRISMDYYMAHPKQLEHIYTALVDSLSLREQSQSGTPASDAISR